MAGTTSIASRVAQLKRLKRGASPQSQQARNGNEMRLESDDDALMASVEADNADRTIEVSESGAELFAENSALHAGDTTFDAEISDEFEQSDLPDNADQSASDFVLLHEDNGDEGAAPWENEASAVADDPINEPADPKPVQSYDDFTDAYDAAASDDDASNANVAEQQDAVDLSMQADEIDLPEQEPGEENISSDFEDDAAFLEEFESASINALDDEELPDLEDDEAALDNLEALELNDTLELADEATADIGDVVPDFAAQEVDELVLASELEAEHSSEAATETITLTEVDAPEAPFSSETDSGEVAVTFDVQRANALKDFSRDMNCSIEDIVVTALDWYLDALFSEEDEARSA